VSCNRGIVKVKLKIEVKDREGRLVELREKESDLILDNFRDVLAALLLPEFEWSSIIGTALTAFAKYAGLVDLGGVARNVPVWGGYTVDGYDNRSINLSGLAGYDGLPAGSGGVRIRIGTSTVAPARNDYKLGAEVANGVPTQTVGADYISWAVSIVLAAAADIAEAGLSIRCNYAAVGATSAFGHFLLFRDTFTAISVPAGGTISVTYTITL